MRIISRHATAAKIGMHVRSLDRLHQQGLGPPRIQLTARRCAYDEEQLEEWLRRRTFSSQAAAIRAAQVHASPAVILDQRHEPPQIRPPPVPRQHIMPPTAWADTAAAALRQATPSRSGPPHAATEEQARRGRRVVHEDDAPA
jgi:predicted DNA-binding transcriptional regulator AlpA